jgi:acetyl esterase/lipase
MLRSFKGCLYLLPCLVLFLACCQKHDSSPTEVSPYDKDSAYVFYNLKYGADSLNRLDLFLPARRDASTEVVLFFHPGGWVSGDKSQFTASCDTLRAKGFIVANMNYRLLSENLSNKAQLEDVRNAILFLKAQSKHYGFNQDKFNLIGLSAGAHIVLSYAYQYKPDDIKKVISMNGPSNLNDPLLVKTIDSVWMIPHILPWMTGGSFVLNSAEVIECSPLYHVKNIPTMIVHGTLDADVPYSQSVRLKDSLLAKNYKHLFISVPGGTHFSYGPQGALYLDSVNRSIVRWFKSP